MGCIIEKTQKNKWRSEKCLWNGSSRDITSMCAYWFVHQINGVQHAAWPCFESHRLPLFINKLAWIQSSVLLDGYVTESERWVILFCSETIQPSSLGFSELWSMTLKGRVLQQIDWSIVPSRRLEQAWCRKIRGGKTFQNGYVAIILIRRPV